MWSFSYLVLFVSVKMAGEGRGLEFVCLYMNDVCKYLFGVGEKIGYNKSFSDEG